MSRWANINSIYQIYPRSFYDSNGDGVGDLSGITEKLSYLKGSEASLGVDAIWLSPFYRSPMRDFGYDISDYKDVDPIFGTIADFDRMVEKAHSLGLKVMIDFVGGHTSSDHPWFQEAINDPASNKRDYYIFRPGKVHSETGDLTPPNNWLSVFGGSAWTPVPVGDSSKDKSIYYMHSFLAEQPSLNWANPKLRQEMQDILRFWLDRGVDGIRADAIRWMAPDLKFRDDPVNPKFHSGDDPYHQLRHIYSRYQPELDSYLRCITDVIKEYDDRIVIFEDHLDDLSPLRDQIRRISSIDPEVSAPFNFQGMRIPFGSESFGEMIDVYQDDLLAEARPFYCFSNHDESRLSSRFGRDQARLLAVLQMMLPGIPVLYYGQEIGMSDADISSKDIKDPFELRVPNKGLGRDPARSPMQWSGGFQAGFTLSDKTWLPIGGDYVEVNVEAELADSNSSLNLYKELTKLRAQYPALRGRDYETLRIDSSIFMFRREDETSEFIVILNFSNKLQPIDVLDRCNLVVSAQSLQYAEVIDAVAAFDGIVIRRDKIKA